MSLPTSSLAKLTISGMPPTSSTSTLHSRTKDHCGTSSDDSSGSEENSEDDSDTSTSRILTSPNTKLHYDTSQLSASVFSHVRAGLQSSLTFSRCSEYKEAEYFALQVSESAVVRVGAPGSKYSAVTCHCDSEPKPCRHIIFVQDQLANRTLNDQQKAKTLPLSRNGVPKETLDAYQSIKHGGSALLTELGCEVVAKHDGADSAAAARADRIDRKSVV